MIVPKQQHSKKKILILIIITVLILAASVCAYFFYIKKTNEKNATQTKYTQQVDKVNYSPPTSEQVDNGTSIKKDSVDNTSNSDNVTNTSNITITVAQKSNDGKYLQIRSYANIVDNTAKCTLSLTNGSNVVSRNADIQTSASISSCKGFDVSTDELPTGTWQATLKYTGDLINGSITKSIEI